MFKESYDFCNIIMYFSQLLCDILVTNIFMKKWVPKSFVCVCVCIITKQGMFIIWSSILSSGKLKYLHT